LHTPNAIGLYQRGIARAATAQVFKAQHLCRKLNGLFQVVGKHFEDALGIACGVGFAFCIEHSH
jgi:hypothetical protein